MDQAPPDQLVAALGALRTARLQPGWAEAVLRLAADLCHAEAGAAFDAEGRPLATYPAAGEAEALRAVAGQAMQGGAVRVTPGTPRSLFGAKTPFGAIAISLTVSNPLHAAVTRERLQLLMALAGALDEGGRHGLGALAAAALGAGLAKPGQEAGLHAAAAALAQAMGQARIVIGLARGGRIRRMGFSDQAVLARGSELVRMAGAALEEALDGQMPGAPRAAIAAWSGRPNAPPVVFGASGQVALLIEGSGARPEVAELLAKLLAPLALARPARARWAPSLRLSLVGAAVLIAAAALLPRDAVVEAGFVLEPAVKHAVTSPLDATLAESTIQPGDRVERGRTVLARLTTRETELELAAAIAKAQTERREADIARARGNPAQEQLALLAAERTVAQIALLEHRLSLAEIRAPADGVVISGDLRRSLGQAVTRGQLLFEIARPEALRAEILVPDERVARVAAGQTAVLAPASEPERRIPVTVTRLIPMAEMVQNRNVFRAVAVAESPEALAGLRAGMEGQARITVGRTSWLLWALGDAVRAVRARLWI